MFDGAKIRKEFDLACQNVIEECKKREIKNNYTRIKNMSVTEMAEFLSENCRFLDMQK